MEPHKGYNLDGFRTNHTLSEYEALHQVSFEDVINKLIGRFGAIVIGDLGCGNGLFLSEINKLDVKSGVYTIGVDRKLYEYDNDRINEFITSNLNLENPSLKAHLIVSNCVANWMKRPQRLVDIAYDSLFPGGEAYLYPVRANNESEEIENRPLEIGGRVAYQTVISKALCA